MPTPAYPFQGYESEDADYQEMMDWIIQHETLQAEKLGEWIQKTFPHIRSVIDIGCGPGIYLLPYQRHGCEIMGVDACSAGGKSLMPYEFTRWDLRFPFAPYYLYDLALCLEVAEHIHEEYADILVENVARSGYMVLWTAAYPGQCGTYHHNEQPHEFWLNKFKKLGYSIHEKQQELRNFLLTLTPHREKGEVCGWLIDNSYLLTR